ncbi:MAG: caspase family protein [Bacteroides sp.]|nr:caspase family protein [Bacteroides sp.]MCM1085476.1 caspase family protein [Bacteroides sp.]
MRKFIFLLALALGAGVACAQSLLDYNEQEALDWYEQFAEARNQSEKQKLFQELSKTMKNPEKQLRGQIGFYKYTAGFDKSGTYHYVIGLYYELGIFKAKDLYGTAYTWFDKAVKKDNDLGKYYMADLLIRGKGIFRNIKDAYELLKGNTTPNALFTVGFLEFYGLGGIEQNERSAYRSMLKASQSIPQAKYFLGLMYAYGRGVKVDYGLAKNYLTFAADDGIEEASNEIERCRNMQLALAESAEKGEMQHAPMSIKNISEQKNIAYTSDLDVNIPGNKIPNENTFVLIIGNENYTQLADVPFAIRDGEVFAKYCNKTLGVPQNNIRIYQDATYGTMLAAMDDMSSIAKAYGENNINIIVYYAGHGAPNDATKEAYLLPVDAFSVNPKVCYALKDFYADLADMKARRIMVFLDACFSGSARAENGEMLASARGVAISSKKEILEGNMMVISATNGSETALPYEKEQHGLFTYFLLKKLQESKGNINMGDLSDYIKTNVARQSVVINKKAQTPTINVSSSATGWENWMLNR